MSSMRRSFGIHAVDGKGGMHSDMVDLLSIDSGVNVVNIPGDYLQRAGFSLLLVRAPAHVQSIIRKYLYCNHIDTTSKYCSFYRSWH